MREIIGVTTNGMSDIRMFADTNFAVFLNSGELLILFNILFIEICNL